MMQLHEKGETGMVLHAALSAEDVVVTDDTDISILMIYAYSKYMVKRS